MTLEALAITASIVFILRLLPQPLRLARLGVADGVSPLASLNGLVATSAWLAYGLARGLPVVWIVSVIAVVPGAWTVVLLRSRTRWTDVAWAAAWVATLVVAGAGGLFAAALGVGVVVTQGPQVVRALRSTELGGLAPATWWVSLLDASTWGAYGIALGDAALMGYAVVLGSAALIVLGRIQFVRARVDPDVLIEPASLQSA